MTRNENLWTCKNIGLAVFDWAGTTVDFGCLAPIQAFIEGFRAKGVEVSLATARRPMGMEKRDHIKAVSADPEVALAWQRRHGRPVRETDIDELYEDFVPRLLSILGAHSRLIPGVLEAVDALRGEGVAIGATTGYFREAAEVVAAAAAAAGYRPEYLVNASEVLAGRPFPWMIYRVMEAASVCPPACVAAIGDTPVDMQAGRNGGVWSVGVAATGNQLGLSEREYRELSGTKREELLAPARDSLRLAGAHFVIDTLAELPAVIRQINRRLAEGAAP